MWIAVIDLLAGNLGTISVKKAEKWLVVSTCTARKRLRPEFSIDKIAKGSQAEVAAAWMKALGSSRRTLEAHALYQGRSVGLAQQAAEKTGSDFGIISAGLGFVFADTLIPGYDITASSQGPSSIRHRLQGPFDPQSWWKAIATGPYASNLQEALSAHTGAFVALSESYARMVADDLSIYAATGAQLRIFGLSIAKHLPADLHPFVMPYDERLSTLGKTGTRVDFPQRALWDFVQNVHAKCTDAKSAALLVANRMAMAVMPAPRCAQTRLDDAGVKKWISEHVSTVGRSRTKLLTHLRRVSGVSCEQGRFFRLCDEMMGEKR